MLKSKSYNVKDVLEYLSKIDESNIHRTEHFTIRANERKSDIYPDANEIVKIILNDVPCGIIEQSEEKFKLIYNIDYDNDFVCILSVKNSDPIRINLVSCFPDEAKKRRREDVPGDRAQ